MPSEEGRNLDAGGKVRHSPFPPFSRGTIQFGVAGQVTLGHLLTGLLRGVGRGLCVNVFHERCIPHGGVPLRVRIKADNGKGAIGASSFFLRGSGVWSSAWFFIMPHFDAAGPPLNDAEIDMLCEEINCGKGHELQADSSPLKPYTVVGLFPQSDWDGSVRDASFVDFVEANTPHEASESARIIAARNPLVFEEKMPEDELLKEAEKYGFQIETPAVFEGHTPDLYDPRKETSDHEYEET